jgi:hypothetical protein
VTSVLLTTWFHPPPPHLSAQAYVLVSKVRLTSDTEMDVSAFQPPLREQTADADAARDSAGSAESDDDEPATPGSTRIPTLTLTLTPGSTRILTLTLTPTPTLTPGSTRILTTALWAPSEPYPSAPTLALPPEPRP